MMKFLAYLVEGLHSVIGITPPTPEEAPRYVVIWLGAIVVSLAIIVGVGYFVIATVFAPAR
jgi:hypothetical protein